MSIFKYLKNYWFYAILAPLFMVGEVLMDLFQPSLMSKIVDDGLYKDNLDLVINTGILMLCLVLLGGLFGILSGVFTNLAAYKYSNDLRKDVFNHVVNLSFEQTDNFTTGSLVTRITNDVTQVTNIVSMSMRMLIRTFMQFVGGLFFLLKQNIEFGIVLLIALPVLVIIVITFLLKIAPLFSKVQKRIDDVNAIVQENVTGARVVKAYTAENKEINRFKNANDNLYNITWKVFRNMSIISPFLSLCVYGALCAIMYIGGINITNSLNTDLKIGELTAAISYITIILLGFMMLAMFFQTIIRGIASIRRLNEILNSDPVVKEGSTGLTTDEVGTVEFKDVSFSYPESNDEVVLDNINLKINKGDKIGILGATGCGKSTLVNLITRFYDVTKGSIFVDGVNVKDYDFKTLRNKVVLVLQKSELFSGTIKDNISWGKSDATIEEIKYASSIAQASSFIESDEDGYDRIVAEKGTSLSGGQKQRISIARALIKNPEILIFDDSTSALDLQTEASLYKAINDNFKEMTIITIAQRVASVRNANKIVVINEGKIESIGTHEELIENSPIYIDIYNSQLKREEE